MNNRLLQRHRQLCRKIKKLILFSSITILSIISTACEKQERKKEEKHAGAQTHIDTPEDADTQENAISGWSWISPQDTPNRTDAQENPDAHTLVKQVRIEGTNVLCGVYRVEDQGDYAGSIGPKLYLYPDGYGEFLVHSASSNIASGGYDIDNGKLRLTDRFSSHNPKDIYTFEIAEDQLIFLADESAEIWYYGPGTAADGMVFTYNEELTEWYMGNELD